ncbi:MAG TPA: hypothetical protein VHR66_25415 [Gemmataceae bacterium]|nr:hypothetical protein [Gemmataceae bacterium]
MTATYRPGYKCECTFISVRSPRVIARSLSHSFVAAFASIALLGFAGCSKDDKPQDDSERNLKALAVLFGKYSNKNRGAGPANEADFKKWIKSLPGSELEGLNVNGVNSDAMFTSPRDNQPYGIAWKFVQTGVPNPNAPGPMVVWEQTGVNGKRKVSDMLGRVEEIDQATFEQRKALVTKQ